ncbi:hypothetical protein KIPB_009229 [Kipferlia bialata]|uniref:Mitochondrial carrier domain-containing protein n=1 Tax=Kipferlia bialata TaxID=797122 RepID=A0A9K3D0M2_9EUKA|nr:hypothetical protein KIPB_006700 [Kipferlia bialata]GIQ87231.1 hypothetical protein KIPB_009229 [Kipferlia bialata]|eukprot:g6700.t1
MPFSGIRSLVAGSVAGICLESMIFPINTMKDNQILERGTSSPSADRPLSDRVRSLYAGFSAVAIGSTMGNALYYSSISGTKALFKSLTSPTAAPSATMAAAMGLVYGAVGEVVGSLSFTPMSVVMLEMQRREAEAVRTRKGRRQERQRRKEREGPLPMRLISPYGPIGVGYSIVQEHGFSALYRGYLLGLVEFVPKVALRHALYEVMSVHLPQTHLSHGMAGCAAACLSAGLLCPMLVIRTHAQASHDPETTVLSTVRSIVAKDGVLGLWKGSGWSIASSAVGATVGDTIYSYVVELLGAS